MNRTLVYLLHSVWFEASPVIWLKYLPHCLQDAWVGLLGAINIFVGEDSILVLYNAVWKLDGADGPPRNANGIYFLKKLYFWRYSK